MARLHSLDHFKRLLEQPDDQINLAEAALVIVDHASAASSTR